MNVNSRTPSALSTLILLSTAVLLGMSLWFGASSSARVIQFELGLNEAESTWLTLAVQLGFVAGTLVSAVTNLPDVVSSRRLFAVASFAGAMTNAAFAIFAAEATVAIALRFLTGFCLAGVYPPGMKLMSTWFRKGRGLAIGVLVGALTLGKASPYLINVFGGEEWRLNTLIVSALSLAGGLLVWFFVTEGPYGAPKATFDFGQVRHILTSRGLRLANLGYFGHMWELYAMWAWTPVMIRASLGLTGHSPRFAEAASFLVLGAGGAGCILARWLADRLGRTLVTAWAMAMSGACCLIIGFFFGAHPAFLLTVAAFWGATVVADSAQFSACVTELGEPRYIGTALTLQTCIGFLLTTISMRMVPWLVHSVGWEYVFVILAPGPFFGVVAMLRLRALPEAIRLANGNR